ncbi:MAG: HAD-IB family hydrolase [Gammaproteobacteria bacterium]|jgi:HAD superfamily hydrolase (TIGR01490 family)
MPLAIFDLDNTLLSGDSDYLWGEFLCDKQIVDRDYYERENQRFYEEYKQGELDIFEFLEFSLQPLSQNDMEQLQAWHREFMHDKIEPLITPKAEELVAMHRERGDTLLIVTATNAFVTAPIAARFGIDNLIATNPEIVAGRYTGHVSGEPSYREGKVVRLKQWLARHGEMLDGSWFYSDSHNDLPLLEIVDNPVVVDPDEILAREAEARGWPVISLR